MSIEKPLDNILNTGLKVKIVRLFISRREDFMASGREIARLVGVSPPAAHATLKELYDQDILRMDIVGRQHIYRINIGNRIVKNILAPAFKREGSLRKEVIEFLKEQIKREKIDKMINSVLLYGSLQTGETGDRSDVDIAVIVEKTACKDKVEKIFIEKISNKFYDYFGLHLDSYVKEKKAFIIRLKKNQPPVSTMARSYYVVYGKDLMELK